MDSHLSNAYIFLLARLCHSVIFECVLLFDRFGRMGIVASCCLGWVGFHEKDLDRGTIWYGRVVHLLVCTLLAQDLGILTHCTCDRISCPLRQPFFLPLPSHNLLSLLLVVAVRTNNKSYRVCVCAGFLIANEQLLGGRLFCRHCNGDVVIAIKSPRRRDLRNINDP